MWTHLAVIAAVAVLLASADIQYSSTGARQQNCRTYESSSSYCGLGSGGTACSQLNNTYRFSVAGYNAAGYGNFVNLVSFYASTICPNDPTLIQTPLPEDFCPQPCTTSDTCPGMQYCYEFCVACTNTTFCDIQSTTGLYTGGVTTVAPNGATPCVHYGSGLTGRVGGPGPGATTGPGAGGTLNLNCGVVQGGDSEFCGVSNGDGVCLGSGRGVIEATELSESVYDTLRLQRQADQEQLCPNNPNAIPDLGRGDFCPQRCTEDADCPIDPSQYLQCWDSCLECFDQTQCDERVQLFVTATPEASDCVLNNGRLKSQSGGSGGGISMIVIIVVCAMVGVLVCGVIGVLCWRKRDKIRSKVSKVGGAISKSGGGAPRKRTAPLEQGQHAPLSDQVTPRDQLDMARLDGRSRSPTLGLQVQNQAPPGYGGRHNTRVLPPAPGSRPNRTPTSPDAARVFSGGNPLGLR